MLARGSGIFKEYYKWPELTEEVLDKEGWYHTDDIGMVVEGGALQIVDRVKSVFKIMGV